MKIAMIGHKRIPSREGGIEIVVEELCSRLARNNTVICYNRNGKHTLDKNKKNYNKKNYKNIILKKCLTIDIKGLSAVSSTFFGTLCILFSDIDVVHFHAEGPCIWLWVLKRFSNKKIIVTIHGLDWKRVKWKGLSKKIIKYGEKCAVKYADEIIVLSKNTKEYFKRIYNRDTNYIPNGISIKKYNYNTNIFNKYNIKKNKYIFFVGRLVPEKRVHDLIIAFNKISTDLKLVIAGAPSGTQKYFNYLKEISNDNPNIVFTGYIEEGELNELYMNAFIFCLPSEIEGMPLCLLEALSYNNCCLTSDIPECKEIIKDIGITFKCGDVEDLKCKIELLINNKNIVNEYKTKSKYVIINKYNWDKIVEKTFKLYKKAVISDEKKCFK